MTLVSTCSIAVLILSCQSLTLSPSFTRLSSTLSRTLANVALFKKMRLGDDLELTRSGPILPSLNLRPLSAKRAGPPVCKRCQVFRLLSALVSCIVALCLRPFHHSHNYPHRTFHHYCKLLHHHHHYEDLSLPQPICRHPHCRHDRHISIF